MATYVPSTVNPSYYEVPTFEAPQEFLFQIQRQKQAKFEQGLDQVGSQYQTMANLPVSSQFALSKRDAYMQEASQKLRSISGADFSLEENRSTANSIYKPLTSDSDILYDLAQSKNAQKQMSVMDQLQNSKDEKERGQYWDTGREYVNSSISKLQNAKTADQLRNAQVRTFVPYTDIISKLNKAAADLKLKVSVDHLNGGYIITKENGEDAHLPFYLFAQSQLGTQEREVLKVLGTVDADRSIRMETARNGGNEGLARTSLAQQAISSQFKALADQSGDNDKTLASIDARRKAVIEGNGNVIDDRIFAQLDDLDTKKEMILQKSSLVDDNLRDLGYNKVNGQYVQNHNYSKTLNYYTQDLSIPYSTIAGKNITNNWAAGLATATTGLSIKADPNFAQGLQLQIEEIKLKSKLADEGIKAAGTSTGTTKEPKPDYINDPLQLDNNPFGRETMSTYDQFQQTKKSYENDLYGKGVDFVQDAGLGLSADFLTVLSENMKNGAANESIKGMSQFSLKDRSEFKQDLAKVDEMVKNGEITARDGHDDAYKYADLFDALVRRAKTVTDEKLKNPPDDPAALGHLVKLSKEVEQNLAAFRVFKDDETKINKQILNSPEFNDLRVGDRFMTKDEFLKKTLGTSSRSQFTGRDLYDMSESISRNSRTSLPGLSGISANFNVMDKTHPASVFDLAGEAYDKAKDAFDKKFQDYVNSEGPKFLSKLPGQNGQIGFTYPIQEWQTRKNPDSGEREIAEIALKRAFQPSNLTDETKILNMNRLGNKSQTMAVANYIQGSLESDITPDMGTVYTVQVGSDGKSPSVIFKPSVSFLKNFVSKGNPLDNSTLNSIAKNGIEIGADVPEIQKYRPSLVGRLIDMDKSYQVLPELKDQGFSASIEKQTNGRGYKIYLDYKTIGPDGKETVEQHKDIYPELSIPEQRLDSLAQATINDILTQYVGYKKQKKVLEQPNIPQKVYTEEEYRIKRQTRF